VVTKPIQLAYIDIAYNGDDTSNFITHMRLIDYVLMNCIDKLEIDGVEFDPQRIAVEANIMNSDTLDELKTIHELCAPYLEGLSEENSKK